MSFKMIYDARNRTNLDKLADNTKIAAYKWYQYCIDKKYQVLIYETIRTKEKQAENVRKGASKTMRSYHLVGQALDFVFVDEKKNALWSINAYVAKMDAINYAKKLGFTWGGDWDNDGDWRDEKFLDSPHLQLNYKGYGTDTYGKIKVEPKVKEDDDMFIKDSTSSTLRNSFIEKLEVANKTGKIDAKWVKQAKEGTLNVVDMILLQEYIK